MSLISTAYVDSYRLQVPPSLPLSIINEMLDHPTKVAGFLMFSGLWSAAIRSAKTKTDVVDLGHVDEAIWFWWNSVHGVCLCFLDADGLCEIVVENQLTIYPNVKEKVKNMNV